MSFRSHRRPRVRMHRSTTWRLIGWLTGAVMAGSTLSAAVPRRSQPYLASIAPLPLRFLPPPPDLSTDPAPAAPPNPDGVVGEVAQSNLEAVAPVTMPPGVPEPGPADALPTPVDPAATVPPEASAAPATPVPTTRPPVEIIPDDLRREVMPEDVLPFFLPPQLPSPPPSRATYRQT